MNLFFFLRDSNCREHELASAAASAFPPGSLEVFSDIESFAGRMRKPKDALSVAVFWNPTREDLRRIASLRDFLKGVRILLVLSDQDEETIALAHRTLPTYITNVEEGLAEVVSVLKKLTRSAGAPAAKGARLE
jgi:hypothetical protein